MTSTISAGIPARTCISAAPARRAPNRSAAAAIPNGCDRPSRATAIASNPIARPIGRDHEMAHPEDLDRSGDPEQQARQGHRQHDQVLRPHPGVARRAGVGPDAADLEPERAPVEQPPDDRHGGERQEDAEVDVAAEDDRQRAVAEIAGPAEREARGQERSEDEPPDAGRAAIELSMIVVTTSWAPDSALRAPGIQPQNAPASIPASKCRQDRDGRRCRRQGGADPGRAAVAASRNWPCPPILNRPALKPSPTASPPRTSGVAWRIVLRMAVCRTERSPGTAPA